MDCHEGGPMELNTNVISNKKFSFKWHDSINSNNIEIEMPDLTLLQTTMWGDWGPMYTFQLSQIDPIKLKYNDQRFESSQKELKISSPMPKEERDQYPFYITIEDSKSELHFHLYLDGDLELNRVKIMRTSDNVKLYENSELHFLNEMA